MPNLTLVGAGVAAVFLVLYLVEGARRRKAVARAGELEAELKRLREAPQTFEYRVERFELIWYPVLTCSPVQKTVVSAAAGLPHCRKCAVALKSDGKEWACAKCGDRRADSVADTQVIDSVTDEAIKQFLARHPDYRSALKA